MWHFPEQSHSLGWLHLLFTRSDHQMSIFRSPDLIVLLVHVHTMYWISPFAHISYQWMSTWPSPISKAETWPSPGFLPFSLSPSPGGPQTLATPSPHSSRILESPFPMALPHHLSHPDHGNGRSALPSCALDHCSSSTFLRMAIHPYKERSQNHSLIWAGRERRDPSGHR